jgi:predicted RNase H-like HicB family nuclease
MTYKYETLLSWSKEDSAYIFKVPQLPGCMAHGSSQEEALANVNEAIGLWLDTAKEFGDPIPESL